MSRVLIELVACSSITSAIVIKITCVSQLVLLRATSHAGSLLTCLAVAPESLEQRLQMRRSVVLESHRQDLRVLDGYCVAFPS